VSYTQVFGGTTLYPSDVSYLALSLTADTTLEWPLESSTLAPVAASIIDVTPTGAFAITMPDATLTAPGQTVLFNNLGPSTVLVKDASGGTILSMLAGTQWSVYLASNATVAGTWRTFQSGASTAQAQASALAGFGIIATGSTLSVAEPVTGFNTNITLPAGARGAAYLWSGGLGTASLIAASTLGNNWFVDIRNGGSGNLTIDPSSSELINGATTLVLTPGDSCRVVTDGVAWHTFGLGRSAVFAFDYTAISLTGQTSPYTLSGSELNRIAYKFTGTLTANMEVVVPSTTQQYWVDNSTTGGSFTLGIRTSAQTPAVNVARGSRGIFYSDGSNVIDADTSNVALPINIADGGTGATTAAGARTALGVAASGANGDITSLNGLTTPLAIAGGGTGATTAGAALTNLGAIGVANANTFTARQTLNGSATDVGVKLKNSIEAVTISATAATGTINYNVLDQSNLWYTTNASGNWTLNIRGSGSTSLNTLLAVGESVTVVFQVTNGATAYYQTAFQIDGNAVTPTWQGGAAPTAGSVNSVDAYTFSIIKTGVSTFAVRASVSRFT
jgi:hypothetical protein